MKTKICIAFAVMTHTELSAQTEMQKLSHHLSFMSLKSILLVLSVLLPAVGHTQGFQNLDFEMASFPMTGSLQSFSAALPFWQGTTNGVPLSTALYATSYLDENQIGIYDSSVQSRLNLFPPPISGQYSAFLEVGGPWHPRQIELAQTGIVPSDAKSIQFATTPYDLVNHDIPRPEVFGQLSLVVNGRSLPYILLEAESNFLLWGADISSIAGTTATIGWNLQTTGLGGAIGLDDISFSTEAVVAPEPSVLGLSVLGLVLLARRLRYGQGRLD